MRQTETKMKLKQNLSFPGCPTCSTWGERGAAVQLQMSFGALMCSHSLKVL